MSKGQSPAEPPPNGPASEVWMDALPQAVVLTVEGLVTRVNAAAARLWGVPQERAAGRPVLEVVRRHTLETLLERGGELELEAGGRTLRCTATHDGPHAALAGPEDMGPGADGGQPGEPGVDGSGEGTR